MLDTRARVLIFAVVGTASGLVAVRGVAFNDYVHEPDKCGEARIKILGRDISRQLDVGRHCTGGVPVAGQAGEP